MRSTPTPTTNRNDNPETPINRRSHPQPSISSTGCRQEDETHLLWSSKGFPSIVALGRTFVTAAYVQEPKNEGLQLKRFTRKTKPRTVATLQLDNPLQEGMRTPPGLGVKDKSHVTVAAIDSQGTVVCRSVRIDGESIDDSPLRKIGDGADTRFAPAVAHLKGMPVIAWTVGTTPMQSRLAVLGANGQRTALHSIAPSPMGAAAPVFIHGHSPPLLLTIDARDGFSPLLQTPILSDGSPGSAKVVGPVSMVSTPVELSAAHGPMGTYVAYTGLGRNATSAVGIVQTEPETSAPRALVPGNAYGRLHIDGIHGPKALLFAADVPIKSGQNPAHEIQLYPISSEGIGPKTVIRGPNGTASHVAIARATDGTVAVAYSTQERVYVSFLDCDDG